MITRSLDVIVEQAEIYKQAISPENPLQRAVGGTDSTPLHRYVFQHCPRHLVANNPILLLPTNLRTATPVKRSGRNELDGITVSRFVHPFILNIEVYDADVALADMDSIRLPPLHFNDAPNPRGITRLAVSHQGNYQQQILPERVQVFAKIHGSGAIHSK